MTRIPLPITTVRRQLLEDFQAAMTITGEDYPAAVEAAFLLYIQFAKQRSAGEVPQ